MKKLTLIVLAILASFTLYGQEITGPWNGVLKVQGMQLRIVFNISQTEEGYSSTMDSPDQGAFGIPVTFTSVEGSELVIKLENLGIEYNGVFDGDSKIEGIFNQAGQSFPLDLAREEVEMEKLVRPQESIEPIAYINEEVTFENSIDSVVLAGTLSMPDKDGPHPAVILISGSGSQNRDEEVFGHKPFLVLADHLTKNGIAVLRFDDRGIGESTGDPSLATSRDYVKDVESALEYLQSRKEIDKKRIGLIGHSEGGMIAPMVASSSKGVDFIVLLAGPGIRGDKLLLMQQELMLKGSGVADEDIEMALSFNEGFFKIIVESENPDSLREELVNYFRKNMDNLPDVLKPEGVDEEVIIESQLAQMTNPWMQY